MKTDFGSQHGLCDFKPEPGTTCSQCGRKLRRVVFYKLTCVESGEYDYICKSCFRRETDQPSLLQRFADWLRGIPCRLGRHAWVDERDLCGIFICARCFATGKPDENGIPVPTKGSCT